MVIIVQTQGSCNLCLRLYSFKGFRGGEVEKVVVEVQLTLTTDSSCDSIYREY